ncbi:MAG: histidine kinase [Gemmiger sp.]|nr:histidine kinase [Gemmiger sp.]
MRHKGHSIRFRIMLLSAAFTLLLSFALGCTSFLIFERSTRRNLIQSAEFNLQLVAGLVEQDITSLKMLANRCAVEPTTVSYLSDPASTPKSRLNAYEKVLALYSANPAAGYIQRLIVTDGKADILQVGSPIVNGTPITQYTLARMPGWGMDPAQSWNTVSRDHYATPAYPNCLPVLQPVYSRTRAPCGVLLMTISTALITQRLTDYQLREGEQLYLVLAGGSYRLAGGEFSLTAETPTPGRLLKGIASNTGTLVQECRDAGGQHYIAVTCPAGNTGLALAQYLPDSLFASQRIILWGYLLLEILLVLGLAFGMYRYLAYLIVRPVGRLQSRMEKISQGDFTADANIEWDNELGEIGRGVNRLSQNIQTMMEARVADEQEKQRLEYRMLQSQISPHFIYNTLNSIKWMATIQHSSGIAEMTTALSRLLKSLSKGSEALIPLREEFALLNDYCVIQQYRFGGAITLDIADISDEALCECLIPRFTLQPLAENAIFHGIEPNGGIGKIWLHITQEENGDICITMEDDGVGMPPERFAKLLDGAAQQPDGQFRQIGVYNVHRRIQYAFGPQYGVSATSAPGQGTKLYIRIPNRTQPTV